MNDTLAKFVYALLLQKMFETLYDKESTTDECSLPFFVVELDRDSHVNGKVKGRYYQHNDFLHTVGSAALLGLSMKMMQMEDLDSNPDVEGLPDNIAKTHLPTRQQYFDQMVGQIVDKIYKPFTPPGPDQYEEVELHFAGEGVVPVDVNVNNMERDQALHVGVPLVGGRMQEILVHLDNENQDDVQSYTMQLLQWYIHFIEFEDAIKEGDVVRCNICLKMMIPFFYGYSKLSNYAIECVDYILKTEVLLSDAEAMRIRLGSFINPHGGQGKNKPADMQQENNILVLKDIIKSLGAGATDKAKVRASLAGPVASDIMDHYKNMLRIHTRQGFHARKADDDDVKVALAAINEVQPFTNVPGRKMYHYRRIRDNAFGHIDKQEFVAFLAEKTNKLKRQFIGEPVINLLNRNNVRNNVQ